jgi:hypothetical protein
MIKSIPKTDLIILGLTFLTIHVALFYVYGIRHLYDGESYLSDARTFLSNGTLFNEHNFFYSLHVLVLSCFLFLFPNTIVPFLVFQIILSGLAAIALYHTSFKLYGRKAALITALIFSIWWDNIHWNVTPMTESLFCSVTCFLIYRLSKFKNSRSDFLSIFILLFVGISLRPTGLLLISGVLAFLLTYYWQEIKPRGVVMVSLGVSIIFTMLVSAYYLFQMWDFSEQYLKGNIVTYVDVNENHFNTSWLRIPPGHSEAVNNADSSIERILLYVYHNPVEFTKAAFLKVFFLLSGIRPYYSTVHNVFTIVWMSVIYAGFYFGMKKLEITPVVVFLLATIMFNCLLVGISTVDWDNRFYIPMEPGIVLISGLGISNLFKTMRSSSIEE